MEKDKKRTINWTREEVWALLEAVEAHSRQVVKKKFSSRVTAQTRQEAWAAIVLAVNAVGGSGRSMSQVEKKWTDTKSKSLMTLAKFRRESTKTGK